MDWGIHGQRLHAIDDGNWSAVCERDIRDIAAIFLREHGPGAARQADTWADQMLARGDRAGHATWRRVLWAIEDMRHQRLREAEQGSPRNRPRRPVPRLYSGIDGSLEQVIRDALTEARDRGQDDLAQTEQAVRAARHARPALSVPDALSAVEFARGR